MEESDSACSSATLGELKDKGGKGKGLLPLAFM
jgi:hypothetical protein